jgi:hypothetical protein
VLCAELLGKVEEGGGTEKHVLDYNWLFCEDAEGVEWVLGNLFLDARPRQVHVKEE